jgi:hypothetical protein
MLSPHIVKSENWAPTVVEQMTWSSCCLQDAQLNVLWIERSRKKQILQTLSWPQTPTHLTRWFASKGKAQMRQVMSSASAIENESNWQSLNRFSISLFLLSSTTISSVMLRRLYAAGWQLEGTAWKNEPKSYWNASIQYISHKRGYGRHSVQGPTTTTNVMMVWLIFSFSFSRFYAAVRRVTLLILSVFDIQIATI